MTCTNLRNQYEIVGCRNGKTVIKRVVFSLTNNNNQQVTYSDGGTDTTPSVWKPGACGGIDPEVVCVTNDGGATIIQAIANFDTSTNPVTTKLYDFNNNILNGYSIIQCPEEIRYDIEKGGDFCLNGQLITRFDIFNNQTQLIEGSYWVNALGAMQAEPDILELSDRPCQKEIFTPYAFIATNANPVTIPEGIKGFSIQNLGENQEGIVYTDIVITGGLTHTMPGTSVSKAFRFNAEAGAVLNGNITVTPAGAGTAEVLYIL